MISEPITKNWVTVPRANVDAALKWAKQYPTYITNDYSVIGGRTEHYQKGNDYANFDFFFAESNIMTEFHNLFGVDQ